MIEQATMRQMAFIAEIERTTGDIFTGSTKQEASRWIDEHKEAFDEAKWAENHGKFIPKLF